MFGLFVLLSKENSSEELHIMSWPIGKKKARRMFLLNIWPHVCVEFVALMLDGNLLYFFTRMITVAELFSLILRLYLIM